MKKYVAYVAGVGMVSITEEVISEEEVPLDILIKWADRQLKKWEKEEWFHAK